MYIPKTSYKDQAEKLVELCHMAPVQDAPMRAFHNAQQLYDQHISRIMAHYRADEIMQGIYWENGKGCDTGCTLHSSDHQEWERQLGIPMIIGRLRDRIFEGLPNVEARDFVLTTKLIPIGADLSMVYAHFCHWLITQLIPLNPTCQAVADLLGRWIEGEKPTLAEWRSAADAAYAAAASAAYATAVTARYAAHVAADLLRCAWCVVSGTTVTARYAAHVAADAIDRYAAHVADAAASYAAYAYAAADATDPF